MTRRAFVIGHPIAHSRSPLIHGYWLKEYGIDGSYERIDVHPDALAAFLAGIHENGFVGGNVTIPHKEKVFALLGRRTLRADRIGAVNTLVLNADNSLSGDNTDAFGFVAHLRQTIGFDWTMAFERTVTILGAGGAARAIIVGLLEAGAQRILVANRTLEHARALVALDPKRVDAIKYPVPDEILQRTSLLINTTSLGMNGNGIIDVDMSLLPKDTVVADIVYVPLKTELLRKAQARNLRVVDGLGMLLHQAVPGFEAWFGVRPDVTPALRSVIVADLTA